MTLHSLFAIRYSPFAIRHSPFLIAVVSLSLVHGCGRGEESSVEIPAVTSRAEDGPVTITITAVPKEVDLSQHVTIRVEVVAKVGVTVAMANYGRELTEGDRVYQYHVMRSDEQLAPKIEDGTLRWTYVYELEFFLADQYELPGARLSYVDERPVDGSDPSRPLQPSLESAPATHEVKTDPITIVVRDTNAAVMSEEELAAIPTLAPIELPKPWRAWWVLIFPAAGAVLLVILLLRGRGRRRAEVAILIPAHEWAYSQIAALIADDLVGQGRLQMFFYRISYIVRGYVERRFSVSAPEMTTEEFLSAAAADARFGPSTTSELDGFLSACDLVKYARHEPTDAECDGVLRAARGMIESTRVVELSAISPQP